MASFVKTTTGRHTRLQLLKYKKLFCLNAK
jgi:hypothetical protein